MNTQPVADARSVNEMRVARVLGRKKEPTRRRIGNVWREKPANLGHSRVWEQAEAARCVRTYRTRSGSRRIRDPCRPCAVFRVIAANWPASTLRKNQSERSGGCRRPG